MAEKKEEPKPFWTTDRITLYAPTGCKFYKDGQEVKIHPRQKDRFVGFGFAETKDAALLNTAHAAIAEKSAVKKAAPPVKQPDVVDADPNKK